MLEGVQLVIWFTAVVFMIMCGIAATMARMAVTGHRERIGEETTKKILTYLDAACWLGIVFAGLFMAFAGIAFHLCLSGGGCL